MLDQLQQIHDRLKVQVTHHVQQSAAHAQTAQDKETLRAAYEMVLTDLRSRQAMPEESIPIDA